MTGSLSTAALLTGTTAGVVALVTFGLAARGPKGGAGHPQDPRRLRRGRA